MSFEGHSGHAGTAAPLLQGRYEQGEPLREGAVFTTYRGRDIQTGRPVAIKVLKPACAGDAAFASRLLAEAQSAVSLHHPNIAQVYDAWRQDGTVYLVVEWVRGINLKDRIRRVAPFPLAVAVDILQACAEALNYAHESGYLHGDVRPENVIITPDGRVKVTDFGVGASIAASDRLQMTALAHSAYYLAPELAEGHAPDARSDIYSLGCILYEMLAGVVPFDAETSLAVAVRHLKDPVPSLRKANPAVPPAVDGIAQKCMQKDPMARYITLKGLLHDVETLQEGIRSNQPLNWTPLKPAPEPPPPAERRRRREEPPPEPPPRPVKEVDGGPSAALLLGVALLAVLMVAVFFGAVTLLTRPPAEVKVPSYLAGMSREQAIAELAKQGLKADVREEYRDSDPAGKVYDTAPKGGTEIRSGKTVILFVSRGPQPVQVPDVIGKPLDDAQREIKAAGLTLGETQEEYSEVVPRGEVISQSPLGATDAARKSPVVLVVSKGPAPMTPEPPPFDGEAGGPPPGDRAPDQEPDPDLPVREHEVFVHVPRSARGSQMVRIVVRNEDGTEQTAYESAHQPGEDVTQTVTSHGARGRCQIRVYIEDELVKSEDV